MRARGIGGSFALFGTVFLLSSQPHTAFASQPKHSAVHSAHTSHAVAATISTGHSGTKSFSKYGYASKFGAKGRRYARGGGLQCVPYARNASGIEIKGNAWTWWDNATGTYQRGSKPESGAVLTFRSTSHMRLGHVAVVTQVVNPRMVLIDHANWWGPGAHGGVARAIPVVDVSENNDWTAVRVGLDRAGDFGSIYPTYGFIYDRQDSGTMVANNAKAPIPALGPAPRDLRPAGERGTVAYGPQSMPEEVAEAPSVVRQSRPIDLTITTPDQPLYLRTSDH
jgi:surface antigen